MKVGLFFWGLTRSLKYNFNSIEERILNILKNENIDYKIFLHTYKFDGIYNNKRASEENILLDFEEYRLLKSDYEQVDDMDKIMKDIKINKYFFKNQFHKKYNFDTFKNIILAYYSKLKLVEMYEKSNEQFDYFIFLRPDVKYLNDFKTEWFNLVNEKNILIPNFRIYYNFNDRFGIMKKETFILFGSLFNKLYEYSKDNTVCSEKFLGEMLNKNNIKTIFINFFFNRVRGNGIEKDDLFNIHKEILNKL